MTSERVKKINVIWNKIHENFIPLFSWRFHPDMEYWYNEASDTLECDCGLSMPVALQDEELNERNIRKLIRDMETMIYNDYKRMGWDIGWYPD